MLLLLSLSLLLLLWLRGRGYRLLSLLLLWSHVRRSCMEIRVSEEFIECQC
jgi:hypothetical protein